MGKINKVLIKPKTKWDDPKEVKAYHKKWKK